MVQVGAPSPSRPPGPLRNLVRFMAWMAAVDPRAALFQYALHLALGLLPAAQVWILRGVFGRAIAVYGGAAAPLALLPWLAGWGAWGLLGRTLTPALEMVHARLRGEMDDAAQQRLQAKAGRLRLEVFERSDFPDILARAQSAASPIALRGLVGSLLYYPQAALSAIALAGVIAAWDPWLVAATIVAALPAPLAQAARLRAQHRFRRQRGARDRLRGYLADVLTSRAAAAEVRAFDLGPWLLDWWDRLQRESASAWARLYRQASGRQAGTEALRVAGLAAGVVWAAAAVANGRLPPGGLAAAMVAFAALQEQVAHVGGVARLFAFGQLDDLFAFLDLGPEEPVGGDPVDGIGDIQAEGVCLRYPGAASEALAGVSLRLRAGERVALVGENGSGKTTLVKVLTGLHRPTAGRVLYGGHDLAGLDLAAVRERTAAVFQDHIRYAFTLRENIAFGRAERADDAEAVRAAAVRGGADAVADSLPDGYATMLGHVFPGGTDLSGGQWQRVAVARAFMRQAELVVLDEPTAALDPLAEAEALRRFLAAAEGRTALLVTHRLGAARDCDRVLVLRAGRLVEEGTHAALLAKPGGEYARLWALQSRWYR